MVSAIDLAKRALISLLKALGTAYGLAFAITRDAADKDVRTAYRKLSRKAHPDRGGNPEHQTKLNASGRCARKLCIRKEQPPEHETIVRDLSRDQ